MKAFPNGTITNQYGVIVGGQQGMDLRDYFAAKIMQSLVMNFENDAGWNGYEQAFIAYKIADAMMEERKEKK